MDVTLAVLSSFRWAAAFHPCMQANIATATPKIANAISRPFIRQLIAKCDVNVVSL
jgi:hypothetical protein